MQDLGGANRRRHRTQQQEPLQDPEEQAGVEVVLDGEEIQGVLPLQGDSGITACEQRQNRKVESDQS